MNVGLTIGVKIANSATAILQRVEAFDQDYPQLPKDWNMRAHIGIDPMLLALSMELALKAWYVFDHNTDAVMRSHNLLKLFEGLKQNSQKNWMLSSGGQWHQATLLVPIMTMEIRTFSLRTRTHLLIGAICMIAVVLAFIRVRLKQRWRWF